MKKAINLGAVVMAALFVCASLSPELLADQKTALKAEQKKDVSDPVLQDIITAFGNRMPRFIDKHGKDIFVADAPITRGSLILALYEYDKSFKMPAKKDFVSKQEFDQLASKVSLLAVSGQTASAVGGADSAQLMNDLMPNMPGILDTSLNYSKVFQNLKAQVAQMGHGENDERFKTALEQTRQELLDLSIRVDNLGNTNAQPKNGLDMAADGDLRKSLEKTREHLIKLEERVNEIGKEKSIPQLAKKDISTGDQSKSDLLSLSKRVDKIENTNARAKYGDLNLSADEMKKDLIKTHEQLAKLEERVNYMEKFKPEPQIVRKDASSGPEESKAYTSTLAKISMGLSMVAALFIAR